MSIKHPIISVTGSSGSGTTSVRQTFDQIFRREHVRAAFVQGDAFHRYDRCGMEKAMELAAKRGNLNFSHFGADANMLDELEKLFRTYAENGTGMTRLYVHDVEEARAIGAAIGSFTPWTEIEPETFELRVQRAFGDFAPLLVDDRAAPGRARPGRLPGT